VDETAERRQGTHRRNLVVIGASAGGVETLKRVVSDLPAGLDASICIVLHIAPDSPSLLAGILARAGSLPCKPASDRDRLEPGRILVAPPDRHLAVEDGRVHLTVGPRENGHRPAVDVLFRSAAAAKGHQVIGVILSGTRGDGTTGLAAIKASGGATVVQDPSEALYAGMPATALAHVDVDAVVPSELVGSTIVALVKGEDLPPTARSSRPADDSGPGRREISICPDCGGVLTERAESGVPLWECRVGHRYSSESLTETQARDVEMALWAAVRVLEDRARLLERISEQFLSGGQPRSSKSFGRQAESAWGQATLVRQALAEATLTTLRSVPVSEAESDELAAGSSGA
jgi:two-component system chemotaxis response regulator CheB